MKKSFFAINTVWAPTFNLNSLGDEILFCWEFIINACQIQTDKRELNCVDKICFHIDLHTWFSEEELGFSLYLLVHKMWYVDLTEKELFLSGIKIMESREIWLSIGIDFTLSTSTGWRVVEIMFHSIDL